MPFVAPGEKNPSVYSHQLETTPSIMSQMAEFKGNYYFGSSITQIIYTLSKDLSITQKASPISGVSQIKGACSTGQAVCLFASTGKVLRSTDGNAWSDIITLTPGGDCACDANDKGEMVVYYYRTTGSGNNIAYSDDHGLTWTQFNESTANTYPPGGAVDMVKWSPTLKKWLLARGSNIRVSDTASGIVGGPGTVTSYGPMTSGNRISSVGYLDGYIYWGDCDAEIWRISELDTSGASREKVGKLLSVDNNQFGIFGNVTIGDTVYFAGMNGSLMKIKNGGLGEIIPVDVGQTDNNNIIYNSTYGLLAYKSNSIIATRRGGFRIINL